MSSVADPKIPAAGGEPPSGEGPAKAGRGKTGSASGGPKRASGGAGRRNAPVPGEPEVMSAPAVIPARFAASSAPPSDRADLGLKLKRARIARDWTLEEVAQRTGVARSTLSKIENGQMSPTYDVLQKITRGMDLDLVELFDGRQQVAPFGRRSVTRAGGGKLHPTSTYEYEVLATDLFRKQMLPFKATIHARSLDDFDGWVRHEGEEFLCVLTGRVEVFTEFYAPVTLEPGDSIYFDSAMGHALVSVGDADAEVLWICTGAAPPLV
ncbi:helix-turn-helix domain-containing protein [Azospirillum sp. ST 5-10]|uniref:helix-turn-helix domain-containing protein n=1 Tax=unclassified Azospirillum TaxID=2630922 RepID=UPI003F4A5DE2